IPCKSRRLIKNAVLILGENPPADGVVLLIHYYLMVLDPFIILDVDFKKGIAVIFIVLINIRKPRGIDHLKALHNINFPKPGWDPVPPKIKLKSRLDSVTSDPVGDGVKGFLKKYICPHLLEVPFYHGQHF